MEGGYGEVTVGREVTVPGGYRPGPYDGRLPPRARTTGAHDPERTRWVTQGWWGVLEASGVDGTTKTTHGVYCGDG